MFFTKKLNKFKGFGRAKEIEAMDKYRPFYTTENVIIPRICDSIMYDKDYNEEWSFPTMSSHQLQLLCQLILAALRSMTCNDFDAYIHSEKKNTIVVKVARADLFTKRVITMMKDKAHKSKLEGFHYHSLNLENVPIASR
jgi:hypothetical protein